jgi:type VI secretion system lysozyme-like protein
MSEQFIRPLFSRLYRVPTRSCTAEEIEEDIRINVESILNSRLPARLPLFRNRFKIGHEGYIESGANLLVNSVLNFGTVDFNLLSADENVLRGQFLQSVREAIQAYEPRIESDSLEVTLQNSKHFRLLDLRIDAKLLAPRRKPVAWQTGPDVNQRLFRVEVEE